MANPVNRKEAILAGENVAPVTREEYFVKEAVSNGGGGGNPGYHVETQNVTIIPQQSVTTVENPDLGANVGSFTPTIPEDMVGDPETMTVVFDGTTYVCHKNEANGYGEEPGDEGFLWNDYPFFVTFNSGRMIATQTAGNHTLYAYIETQTIVTDEDFNEAVTQVVSDNIPRQVINVSVMLASDEQILSSTYEQIWNYFSEQGLPVYISRIGFVCSIASGSRSIYVLEKGPNGNATASFPFSASADDARPRRNIPTV